MGGGEGGGLIYTGALENLTQHVGRDRFLFPRFPSVEQEWNYSLQDL